MYYELFDHFNSNQQKVISKEYVQSILNKCFIDFFFDTRSNIPNDVYNIEDDINRITRGCYKFIVIQRIISGISKGVWLGLNPKSFNNSLISSNARILVPDQELYFYLQAPVLYLNKEITDEIKYEDTCLLDWENLLIKSSKNIHHSVGIGPKIEGFRSNLVRTLEGIYHLQSPHPKRCLWMKFLYDLTMSGQAINLKSYEDKFKIKFKFLTVNNQKAISVEDHPVHPYLEFNWMKKLNEIKTSNSLENLVESLSGVSGAFEKYSILNKFLLGKLPICHFYINEHMFVAKEEHSFNNYFEFFIKPWNKSGEHFVTFINNETNSIEKLNLQDFANKLKIMRYSIILGVNSKDQNTEEYIFSQPQMVKDLSLA